MLPISPNTQATSSANHEAPGKYIKHNRTSANPSGQKPGICFRHAHKQSTSLFIILQPSAPPSLPNTGRVITSAPVSLRPSDPAHSWGIADRGAWINRPCQLFSPAGKPAFRAEQKSRPGRSSTALRPLGDKCPSPIRESCPMSGISRSQQPKELNNVFRHTRCF